MAKILLVEDDRNILQLYERIFMQHEITSARDAKTAYQELEGHQYDLIVLDMHLTGASGMDILRHIRTTPEHHEATVFVISADDLLKYQAQDVGIQRWMTKPIDIELLLTAVGELEIA